MSDKSTLPLLNSNNPTLPLLNSVNPPSYSYSNNHVINPIHFETNKSKDCCDKDCIRLCSFIIFIACILILIIIHYS